MWPLTIYEVPISKLDNPERMVGSSSKIKVFPGVLLYRKGMLELLLLSLTQQYQTTKVSLYFFFDSRNPCVSKTAPSLATGWEWTPGGAAHWGGNLSSNCVQCDEPSGGVAGFIIKAAEGGCPSDDPDEVFDSIGHPALRCHQVPADYRGATWSRMCCSVMRKLGSWRSTPPGAQSPCSSYPV